MDLDTIGYFLFMESQEKKEQDIESDNQEQDSQEQE